jgi:EamA domain-containing membrane protein RarD
MKTELKWIAFCIAWISLIGWMLPWMISAASTLAVIGGFALFLACAYGSYRFIRKQLGNENAN